VRALILNCTLKPSPAESNTEALANVVGQALGDHGVEVEHVRVVDHHVRPGVSSDEGDGDEWPAIREMIVGSEILVVASPTWLGQPSSIAKRVLERMDAMLSEQDDEGRPVAYNRVAGVVVTGPGPSFLEEEEGREWSRSTGVAAASNLAAVARALADKPVPAPAG
jgi:multimeric flavodoxin WrbA